MPSRVMARGGRRVMSRPSYSMAPVSGFRYPVIMLMNVVLPAPLVPISPTTESLSIAALTSCAAVTAPKRLHRPRASRMTGMASKDRPQAFRQEDDQREEREPEAHLPGVRREPIGERVNRA